MRSQESVFCILLAAASLGTPMAAAREAFLTSEAKTTVQSFGAGEHKREILSFNYGELEITLPRPTTNWVYNPMMLRPQLLLLRCPPLSNPTSVHLELLADNKREKPKGYQFSLLDPGSVAQRYANDSRVAPTAPLGMPGAECFSYRETPPANAAPGSLPRKETHVVKIKDVGFRLHMQISPQIKPQEEAALRHALSNLTFRGFNVETKSDANDISFLETPPPSPAPQAPVESPSTVETNAPAPAPVPAASSTPSGTEPVDPGPPDICLLEKALTKRVNRVTDSGTVSIYTFNYGGLEISIAPPFSWAASGQVKRPHLLLLQNGPAASPSRVRLDLLARKSTGTGEGLFFKFVAFTNAVENYATNSAWTASTAPLPVPGMAGASFQHTTPPTNGGPAELVHLLNASNLTFRVHVTLSPQIKPADSISLYNTLSNLTIKVTSTN